MQQNTLRHKVDMLSILTHAKEAIANAAATTGIDAGALLPCLPDHSVFLKGNEVPVLAKRYKGCCSVRFYYNQTSDGQPWPFFRFYSFKDGGLSSDFNGLRWLRQQPKLWLSSNTEHAKPVFNAMAHAKRLSPSEQAYEKQRAKYFMVLDNLFASAKPVATSHPYLQQRLCGLATSTLLRRINMRCHSKKLWVPIEALSGKTVGFQAIDPNLASNNKRTHVAFAGATKGSFVRITPISGLQFYSILFCEGVMTALSLALVWPGEIRAVLSCNNYLHCRKHLNERVYFAHDLDVYKPQVGNVGLNRALAVLPCCFSYLKLYCVNTAPPFTIIFMPISSDKGTKRL
ncbi:hypothetical protein LMJ53_15635 [Rheinheimera sp. UJ51]|uniref:hypothetical protein n=1 Tax=Rheinheimera sp. UJ51 TaxID=2892446 RepID=UPI001E37D3F6|nr:hypothetical protein [Rheinheimera sp. UJ51]MCC5453152.1 hypothetical protein [Rheinheimera sp. UJ51]